MAIRICLQFARGLDFASTNQSRAVSMTQLFLSTPFVMKMYRGELSQSERMHKSTSHPIIEIDRTVKLHNNCVQFGIPDLVSYLNGAICVF